MQDETTRAVVTILVSTTMGWVYYAVLQSSTWQASVGKKALNLKVVDAHGSRISFGRATGRCFAMILSGLPLAIGFIMAGFTDKKRALHDIIAGTYVARPLGS